MRQLEHHEVKNKKHNKNIVVIVENVTSPENVGMIFRIGEAMGISKVYIVGNTPTLPNRKISKTARTTDKIIPSEYFPVSTDLIEILTNDGFECFALEVTDTSKNINTINFQSLEKIAIIIGSEAHGIKKETLAQLKNGVMIPMYGKNTSINVVNALTVILYEIVRN